MSEADEMPFREIREGRIYAVPPLRRRAHSDSPPRTVIEGQFVFVPSPSPPRLVRLVRPGSGEVLVSRDAVAMIWPAYEPGESTVTFALHGVTNSCVVRGTPAEVAKALGFEIGGEK